MTTSSSRVTGLVSGFDTQSIVESFMAMEKVPMTKLEVKKQTEDLKLQAYQAVNTYVLKFKNSLNTLASKKLWNSKATVSTNEKAITATANEYAVNGSYSFKVAQLATATQYMSQGFASKNTALAPKTNPDGTAAAAEKLGTISVSSGKARVDNSAELESLNGGKGVYRGSIRVTDASNTTSIIDLSSCVTMDDVVRSINESTGAQISASLKEGRLVVEDESNGSGSMKIINVGTGTTATDLGIVGSSKTIDGKQVIEGRNVYVMGNKTALSELNDGLGAEEGRMSLKVANSTGSYYELIINTTGCSTVGDLIKNVNSTIAGAIEEGGIDPDGFADASILEGLTFGLAEDGISFALSGTKAGLTYEFKDPNFGLDGKGMPAQDLGLTDNKQTILKDNDTITYGRVFGGVNSPMLKNLSGARGEGVGVDSTSEDNYVPISFDMTTPLSAMNKGKGLDLTTVMQVVVYEGGRKNKNDDPDGDPLNHVALNNIVTADDVTALGADATVEDFVNLINTKLNAYANDTTNPCAAALVGMKVEWDSANGCLGFTGVQAGYEYEIYGSAIDSIGLSRNPQVSSGWSLGTNTDRDAAQNQAIQDFVNGDRLITGNDFLNRDVDGEYVATLNELVALAGVDKSHFETDDGNGGVDFDEEAWKQASLDALAGNADPVYGGKSFQEVFTGNFTITYGDGGSNSFPVDVEWSDVMAKLGNPADSDAISKIKVDDFIAAVNDTITETFAGETFTDSLGFTRTIHPPQLKVSDSGDSLAWSNIDYSKHLEVTGLDAFGLDRNTMTDPNSAAYDMMTDDYGVYVSQDADKMPMVPGYVNYEDINAGNASQHKISELNLGFGLQLQSASGEVLAIAIDDTADPDRVLQIAVDDIIAGLQAKVGSGNDIQTASVQDYLDVLNALAQPQIDDMNTALGKSGDDAISFKFGISNQGLALTDIKNVDTKIVLGGGAANGLITGVGDALNSGTAGGGVINKEDFANGTAEIGKFNAASYNYGSVAGIGSIQMTLGNGSTIDLSTDGLTSSNTLADLLDKLNSEMDAYAADMTNGLDDDEREALQYIRFTLNDAGTGIAVNNTSNKAITFHDTKGADGKSDNNMLAQDLGLIKDGEETGKVEAYSNQSAGSVGRKYISRATDLEEWIGTGAEKGGIRITDATGASQTIDVTQCETIGDVIDAINMGYNSGDLGVYAQLNETGDGIVLLEKYLNDDIPSDLESDRQITIEDQLGGVVASKLGLAGSIKVNEDSGWCEKDNKLSKTIDVMSTDTLESIMYRLSEVGYKAAIINDGTSANPYRLSISASSTGKANDFVIESDIEMFGFNQTQQGRDSKVLYGDPNSTSSPTMLSSSTNSNSNAILGLTLDLKQVTNEWTTITVDTDKEKVTEEIKAMVESYNELSGIISMLDGYDSETGEKGILYNDSTIKNMMDAIDDYFYMIFDPENLGLGATNSSGKQASWSWQDLGITLTAANSNSDGTGSWYSIMDLDTDKLEDMVASNWDTLSAMLAGERNIASSNLSENVRSSGSFNGGLAAGYDQVNSAINGDASKSGWGVGNGIMASDTIANGANTYTVLFQQATTVTRMNIFHFSNDTSLKDFDIEYLDPKTGEWETLRSITGNVTDTNYLSVTPPREVSGLRIVASSTNAKDDIFRLVEFQAFEETGLASKLNQYVNKLGDTTEGFLATQNTEIQNNISDIEDQMARLQNKLDQKEESLWRKFTAMEVALGKLQNQGNYFNSMMGTSSSSSSSS